MVGALKKGKYHKKVGGNVGTGGGFAWKHRFLATYNSLTDKHLAGYFSNARIRRHLQRSGLISRSGRIISEKEYRLNTMRKDHQRYVQECLARAIFHKVLDMERRHQLEIRRKLENAEKKERVQKIKVEHYKRSVEGASPMRSPHPPLGPRIYSGLHPLAAGEAAGRSQRRAPGPVVDYNPFHQPRSKERACSKTTFWRPSTAPGNIQHPLRLQPLHSSATVGSVPKTSSSKQKCHALEHEQQSASGGERSGLRIMNPTEYVTGRSPYQLPIISSNVVPVPPPPLQKGDRSLNVVRNGLLQGRRFRPTTAPNDAEHPLTKNSGGFPKPSLRTNAFVTMVFLGKSVHLSHDDAEFRDEIKVYQQHCGGENLCVFKGKLLEGETFQFVSKRHHGFPFSLTFFLNGMQVDRLSCCCEYKHQKRSRRGGRHRYFGFLSVEGASPCYRCIIAMGLDKKPSPPKRKMEEDHEERREGSWGDGAHSQPSLSSAEQKPRKGSLVVILPCQEASAETLEDKMEAGEEYRKEERKKLSDRESEDSQEDTSKNEYDEDFEADEEVNEEGQIGDQMKGGSKLSSDDKNHYLNYEKGSKTSSQEALQGPDSEKEGSDGCSDRDSEDDKQDGSPAHSLSSISTQYSSEEDSHAAAMKEDIKCKANTAVVHCGNENREKKLPGMEENQETSALEKNGIDKADQAKPEDLTAREDTGIFHESILKIQHHSPDDKGEVKQTGPVEITVGEDEEMNASTRRQDGEEGLSIPLESGRMEAEDDNEEPPLNVKRGVPDGAFLAAGTRTLDMQKAAEQVVLEGQVVGERQALEKEDVAEGGDASTKGTAEEREGGLLPKEDRVAVLPAEGQLSVEECALRKSTTAEEDLKGKGTGEAMESGAAVAPGGQEVLMEGSEREATLGKPARGGEGQGREADGAVSKGEEVGGDVSKGEEAGEEAVGETGPLVKEVVGKTVSEAEEAVEEGDFAGKIVGAVTVSEAEEAVEDANLSGEEIAGGAGPEGVEDVEEVVSEREEAVEKPGALLETSGDTNICTAEAMPGGEGFVKSNEFSQLSASGDEQMEVGRAASEAATFETGEATEVEGSSVLRAGAVEESVEADKGLVLQVAPGLEALVDAGEDPMGEGLSQLEENTTVEGVEGSTEALPSGNPSLGSKGNTGSAMEEKPDGEVMGVSAEVARAESAGGGEVTGGAAEPRLLAAGVEGWQECAAERGKERPPGEGLLDGARPPAQGLCVSEVGVVAVAVLGSQARPRTVPAGAAGEPALLGAEGQGEAEWDTACLVSPRHGELGGMVSPGERLMAETSLSIPVHEDRGVEPMERGSTGAEGLAAPGTGALGGKDGPQERTEQAGVQAEGEQPGPCEDRRERGIARVLESTWSASAAREQRRDCRVGGSPDNPGAADVGERSCSPGEDVANPDTVVKPLVQPQDTEETLL